MAKRPPLTLQQLAPHAQEILWSWIIGGSIIGGAVTGELARRLLPRWR